MPKKTVRNKSRPTIHSSFIVLLIFVVVSAMLGMLRLSRQSIFFNKSWRTNIVINSDPLLLLSFSSDNNDSLIALTLPQSTFVEVPYGYGPYRLQSVWRLSELEKKPSLQSETVADLLGLPVAGFIQFANSTDLKLEQEDDLWQWLRSHLGFGALINFSGLTNLSIYDKLVIAAKVRFAKPDNRSGLFLTRQPSLFRTVVLPNGEEAQEIDQEALDVVLGQRFELTQVREESLLVSIENATDVGGVGKKFSRYISRVGGKVVTLETKGPKIGQCELVVKENMENKVLTNYLKREFSCSLLVSSENEVDLVMRLGDVFGNRWK